MLKNVTNELLEYDLCINNNWSFSSLFQFYPTYIFSLFTEKDKIDTKMKYGETEENKNTIEIEYCCSVGSLKKRMGILGINLNKVKEYFNDEVGFDFEEVVDSFKFLVDKEIDDNGDIYKLLDKIEENDNKFNFLDALCDDKYGINGRNGISVDLRILLRSALEAFSEEDEVSLYINIDNDEQYYNPYLPDEIVNDLNVVSYYQNNLLAKSVNEGKIIVLTEGSSDIEFLQKSLNLLYPELAYLFSFFDFKQVKSQGGTSTIINYLKSFISAGFNNRIIVILDNDTAGNEAYKQIQTISSIPINYKIFTLPEIDIANKYPTIGPQSKNFNMNINGKAVSIELFLGKDLLLNDENCYFPALWTGYNDKLKQYQGEISAKFQIQENFRKKIAQIENGTKKIEDYDWTEMKSLLDKIFTAFE